MVPSTGFEPVNLYGADLESDAFGQLGYIGLLFPRSVRGYLGS